MLREELDRLLEDANPEALTWDGFDEDIIGLARRCGQPTLVVYDYDECIDVLVREGMSHEDAVNYFEYNVVGAWVGEHTPLILTKPEGET